MQVFLPYPDFEDSVSVLDNKRLGNQIYREAKTIISGGWPNHPVCKMWAPYRYALCNYCLAGLEVMRIRAAWKSDVVPRWEHWFKETQNSYDNSGLPPFIGNEKFHAAMRSNLLRKDPDWYGQFGWKESQTLAYVWPKLEDYD